MGDRRVTADRRVSSESVPVERRRGERRSRADRRAGEVETFSLTDTALIQTMFADETIAVACPECDGKLLLGPRIFRKGFAARKVQCTGCSRSTLIRDLG